MMGSIDLVLELKLPPILKDEGRLLGLAVASKR